MRPDDLHIVVLARAVAPLHGVGGLERHVHDLIRHVLEHGVQVTLITQPPYSGKSAVPELFGDGKLSLRLVPYWTFPFAGRRFTTVVDRSSAYPLFGWRAGRLAAGLVRRGGIQLVYGLGAASLGYAIARRADRIGTVPLVLNPQGLEEFGATGPGLGAIKHLAYAPLREAVRACAGAADRVIATDRVLVPTVLKHLGVSGERVSVIPNAVDLKEIDRLAAGPPGGNVGDVGGIGDIGDRAGIRQRLGLSSEDVLLLGVGRLEENKGFHGLIAALARLAGRSSPLGERWRCVILGDGPDRPRLLRAVASSGLGAHILLPGRVSDAELHAWYEAATLFVHPTLYEGSSLVTLEAMAHRRAVVATSAGGLPDKVRPGQNGWLVEPGDVDALAGALAEALGDRNRLHKMGAESRLIVEREFAWTSVVVRLLDLFNHVLAGSGTSNSPETRPPQCTQ